MLNNWFEIVKRTAQHGLDESAQSQDRLYFWLAIWSLDVVCEAGEFNNSQDITEAGDVLWGIAASAMLLGITQDDLIGNVVVINDLKPLSVAAYQYADHAKKVARDSRLLSNELPKLKVLLIEVFCSLYAIVNVNEALQAVDAKLKKRYPNGYTPQESINRVV